MSEMLGQGPVNLANTALIPEAERRFNPVDLADFALQVLLDMVWYEENYGPALDEFLKIISA